LIDTSLELASLAIRNLIPRIATESAALVGLVIALALIFAGRFLIRVIAFLAVGVALGSAAAAIGSTYLGIVGFVLGGVIGFFVGGFLSLFLLPLAIGFATGLVVYHLAQTLVHVYLLSVALGVIFFVVGLFLSLKLLALASVVFGGLLLFDVLVFFHFPGAIALLVAILMGVIGFWVQDGFESKGRQGSKFSSWSKSSPPPSAVSVNPSGASSSTSPSSSTARYCAHCGSRVDNPTAVYCPNCGASLGS
jgi:hypothetical protein